MLISKKKKSYRGIADVNPKSIDFDLPTTDLILGRGG